GEIDFITTDHAGCDYKTEKQFDDFSRVYSGIPGIELLIPYIFSEFYIKEEVPLSTMIKITSENPAKRFGLYPQKGSLEIGTDADFTVLDINLPFKVNEQELHSKGKYSPFNEEIFDCSIDKTIVRGEIVFDRKTGIKKEPGYGKWIRREF
ncbi:MAG: amidohydrolase family protein, partial [Candidatus Cloacimonetes bacterium]|nr:amidohydrolase family protein [Candidatus Cloacimonadota bacterium]